MVDDAAHVDDARTFLVLAAQNDPGAMVRWQAMEPEAQRSLLLSVPAQSRRDLLFWCDDATDLVQSLPATVVHETVLDLPSADSQAILGCASGGQVASFLDLDCCRGDPRGDQRRFSAWLERILDCGLADREHFWRDLDLDLFAELVRPRVAQIEGEDVSYLADDLGAESHFTPDHLVTHHGQGRDDLLEDLLQRMYAVDYDSFAGLCRRLRAGDSDETAHAAAERQVQRRTDFGLPSRAEAQELEGDISLPAAVGTGLSEQRGVTAADPRSFLDRVLERIAAEPAWADRQRLALGQELLRLANCLLVLQGTSCDDQAIDPEAQFKALSEIHRRVGLGLEWRSGSDLDRAGAVLASEPLIDLARIGRRLLRDLAVAAVACQGGGQVGDLALDQVAEGRLSQPDGTTRPIVSLADLMLARNFLALARP